MLGLGEGAPFSQAKGARWALWSYQGKIRVDSPCGVIRSRPCIGGKPRRTILSFMSSLPLQGGGHCRRSQVLVSLNWAGPNVPSGFVAGLGHFWPFPLNLRDVGGLVSGAASSKTPVWLLSLSEFQRRQRLLRFAS